MDEKNIKYLFCFDCHLKFDKDIWYDLHLSLVHGNENETKSLENKTQNKQEEVKQTDLNEVLQEQGSVHTLGYGINMPADLSISGYFSSTHGPYFVQ